MSPLVPFHVVSTSQVCGGRGPQSPLGIGCFSNPPTQTETTPHHPQPPLTLTPLPRGKGVALPGTCTPSPSPCTSSLVSGPSFHAVSTGKVGAMLAASAWTLILPSVHCVPRPEPKACLSWASPPNLPPRPERPFYLETACFTGAWDGQGRAPPQGNHLPEEVPSLSPGPSGPSSGSWCCGCRTKKKARPGPLRSGHVCTHAHTCSLRLTLTVNIKTYDPQGRDEVLGIQWAMLTPRGPREGLEQPCSPLVPPWACLTLDSGRRAPRCRHWGPREQTQGDSVSVIPWSTALLVAIEATGQVLRGSGGPHSRPSQPPDLAQTCGHVHVAGGALEEQLPGSGRGWGGGGHCVVFSCEYLAGTTLLGRTAHKGPLGTV